MRESMEVKEEVLCLLVLSYDKPHTPPVTTAVHSGIFVHSKVSKSSLHNPTGFSYPTDL